MTLVIGQNIALAVLLVLASGMAMRAVRTQDPVRVNAAMRGSEGRDPRRPFAPENRLRR